jgi:ubiquinone/menaquinone biosynthesis C-methylase UbiE
MSKRFTTSAGVQEPIRTPQKIRQQIRFDQQATRFDARAGVPQEAARATARELIRLAGLTDGHVVVDIGAGTGSLGSFVAGSGVRYIGLDISLPMLQTFASKLIEQPLLSSKTLLVAADADADWPLVSGSTAVVFFSRSVHLLSQAHVIQESLRVAHPEGAFLVIGRVRRSPESIRSLLREEMQRLLSLHRIAGKKGEETHRSLIAALEAQGCRVQKPRKRTVATWTVEESPRASFDAWRSKEGLAGTLLPAPVQQAVLEELERWAKARFGSLQQVRAAQEHYDLTIVELDPRSKTERRGEGGHS